MWSSVSDVATPLDALVVAYNYPPVGGAGVQRMSKLVRYLPLHGVTPSVLTVANPSVPLRDASLHDDQPFGVEVVRARTLEPGYGVKAAAWSARVARPTAARRAIGALSKAARTVLVPDPQVLWLPAAHLAMASRLWRRRDHAVLVSGPPFSQFVLAALVRARRRVGIVLDYRDEWSTYRTAYEMTGSRAARVAGDVLEPALLRCAHRVTTATEEFREELLQRHRFLSCEQVTAIPNGYDPADFPAALPEPPHDRFVVTYAGTVFRLTSPRGLLGAIRRLHAREPALAKLLEVRFVGRIVDTELALFEDAAAIGVTMQGYVPHDEVLASLAASHLTLCLLDDVPGVSRIYPAKIFELLHLGRPVLTLAPEGALTRLARHHELGDVVRPRDEAAIAAVLERHLRAFRDSVTGAPTTGARASRGASPDAARYDRRALAGRFAEVLRDAAAEASC
jgi:glycosyltransferase involved in cell wall biosynthesis